MDIPIANMPTRRTPAVYPGQVILEGTNLSEGRGTTMPFELFGAPFLDTGRLLTEIPDMKGVKLRQQPFEPVFNKWQGKRCWGFQVHVTDPGTFKPFRFTLNIVSAIFRMHPGDILWIPPPYEYDYVRLPADLIIGSRDVRMAVESGIAGYDLDVLLRQDESEFLKARRDWLVYD